MKGKALLWWLGLIALAAVAALVAVFLSGDAEQRDDLRSELAKGLIQLIVVVVFGAALKLLVDHYQAEQQRAAQNRQFRQDKYDRLVQATNQLRRVWILIDANRSAKTWSHQMLSVINAGLTLRMIKHQIYSSRDLTDPPFPNHRALVHLFELMYRYTDWVAADFAQHNEALDELQRQADEKDLPAEERIHRQAVVWNRIRELESVADARRTIEDETRSGCRASIEQELQALNSTTGPVAEQQPTWLAYEEAETLALESMTRATLMKPDPRRPPVVPADRGGG